MKHENSALNTLQTQELMFSESQYGNNPSGVLQYCWMQIATLH